MRGLLLPFAAVVLLCSCKSTSPSVTHIHFTDTGGGSEALVFIHGWACDSSVWSEQIPALADVGRLIAIDLPGHGGSDKPEMDYTMDYFAETVDRIFGEIGVEKAIMVGHSNGVPLVRHFYRRFPQKTLALITVDGNLVKVSDREQMEPAIDALRSPAYKNFARKLTKSMVAQGSLTEEQRARIEKVASETPQHVMVSSLLAALDPAIYETDPIPIPVMMLNVKQPTWNEAYMTRVRAIAKDLEYHEFEGINHFLMMEMPEKFNRLVREFVAIHDLLRES